jgi:hypothetical protein
MPGLLERQVKDNLQLRGAHAAKPEERIKNNHPISIYKSIVYMSISYIEK